MKPLIKLRLRLFFVAIVICCIHLCCYGNTTKNSQALYNLTTAIPGQGYYQEPKQITNVPPENQSWSGYCPKCTLPNQTLCKKYSCAKTNLISYISYQGIQVTADQWINLANDVALFAVQHGGGPFGAVLVQVDNASNKIIRYWIGYNHTVKKQDPTAHAEISVIRQAAKQLGVLNLGEIHRSQSRLAQPGEISHCILYSSTEPCQMCLSAVYWSGIKKIYFSATRFDADAPGVDFSDKFIHDETNKSYAERNMVMIRQMLSPNSLDAFNYYKRSYTAKRYGSIQKSSSDKIEKNNR